MILGFKPQFVDKILNGSKIHTIREDKHSRWKAGRIIQFATGTRTKKHKKFKLGMCKSVQKIIIKHYEDSNIISLKIDGKERGDKTLLRLALNDGFENRREFIKWFNKDFNGVIIQWTDFKY